MTVASEEDAFHSKKSLQLGWKAFFEIRLPSVNAGDSILVDLRHRFLGSSVGIPAVLPARNARATAKDNLNAFTLIHAALMVRIQAKTERMRHPQHILKVPYPISGR